MGGEGLDFIRNVNRLTFHNRIAQCFQHSVGMGINKFWRFSLTRSNRRKPARKNSLQIDSRDSTSNNFFSSIFASDIFLKFRNSESRTIFEISRIYHSTIFYIFPQIQMQKRYFLFFISMIRRFRNFAQRSTGAEISFLD